MLSFMDFFINRFYNNYLLTIFYNLKNKIINRKGNFIKKLY